MKAMILAAGRGERMRPLTDATPKPLLQVGGKPLIVWHLERLAEAGLRDVIINHAWLGMQIEAALGDGAGLGLHIRYSPERPGGLETAGGIALALPFFENQPFLVINADIWCDWHPSQATAMAARLSPEGNAAWLLMTDNPPQHPDGDFILMPDGHICDKAQAPDAAALTFAGIGAYLPSLFNTLTPGDAAPLAPVLRIAMAAGRVCGSRHEGVWEDIGTPERLASLRRRVGD
ncbi:nucleotidyltransferase family protein [Allopusillimonas soli]|uniref:Nucleotidyltransferase family protein n=1 Tax=Allopusillimonas soli TaxID=659016 RepID=A0A853FJ61_9BURK|nr:nucleotidyltransferase family protein [Allopusillimonas soli]NYT38780.1 nucleotidyltransferase family protein [Allopusillimonas soli]TEA70240.1 nucleotidyltransferase family protein [Allopusillimonas soli]